MLPRSTVVCWLTLLVGCGPDEPGFECPEIEARPELANCSVFVEELPYGYYEWTHEYDAAGRRILTQEVFYAGAPDIEQITRDAAGRVLERLVNGQVREQFTYGDGCGHDTARWDVDRDGSIDLESTQEHDARGRRIYEHRTAADNASHVAADSLRYEAEVDISESTWTEERDHLSDGSVDERRTLTVDATTQLPSRIEVDMGPDGALDATQAWTGGRHWTRYEEVVLTDQVVTDRWQLEYFETQTVERSFDGIGFLELVTVDIDSDGEIDRSEVYERDNQGREAWMYLYYGPPEVWGTGTAGGPENWYSYEWTCP